MKFSFAVVHGQSFFELESLVASGTRKRLVIEMLDNVSLEPGSIMKDERTMWARNSLVSIVNVVDVSV